MEQVTAEVLTLPDCDVHMQMFGTKVEAHYDGALKANGQWGFMCDECWEKWGTGKLGSGLGQRLVLVAACDLCDQTFPPAQLQTVGPLALCPKCRGVEQPTDERDELDRLATAIGEAIEVDPSDVGIRPGDRQVVLTIDQAREVLRRLGR